MSLNGNDGWVVIYGQVLETKAVKYALSIQVEASWLDIAKDSVEVNKVAPVEAAVKYADISDHCVTLDETDVMDKFQAERMWYII